jgi:cytochrome c oxidase assembly factor CtaG
VFLAAGLLFWWPVVAVDTVPRKAPYPLRVVYLIGAMLANLGVGLGLFFATTALYPH